MRVCLTSLPPLPNFEKGEDLMKDLNRRDFAKSLGIGAAALSLVAPSAANAITGSENEKHDGFSCALGTLMPVISINRHLTYGDTVKLYKNDRAVTKGKYLEINGMGSLVVQLCRGYLTFDEVVDFATDVYRLNRENVKSSVSSFLRFLFDEGLLSFSSDNFLSEKEKKRGRGINLPNRTDTNILIQSKNKSNLTF
jgi:hypothetical protein